MNQLVTVQIFLFENFLLTSAVSFFDTIMIANRISEASFRSRWRWNPEFVSVKGGEIQSSSGIKLKSKVFRKTIKGAILFVPGLDHLYPKDILNQLPKLSREIQTLKRIDTQMYVSCSAGYLLAEAGVLNSKSVASSWWLHSDFANRYPDVNLLMDKLLVSDKNITTSGGAFSSIDLALRAISDTSKEILSKSVANFLAVDPKRQLQSPYSQWLHISQEPWLLALEAKVLKDLSHPWQIEDLAKLAEMHPRTFFRKMKEEMRLTPKKYLEKLRIQKAKQMLTQRNFKISDLCFHCGYEDLSHFQKVFKKNVGMGPGEYRNRFYGSE